MGGRRAAAGPGAGRIEKKKQQTALKSKLATVRRSSWCALRRTPRPVNNTSLVLLQSPYGVAQVV